MCADRVPTCSACAAGSEDSSHFADACACSFGPGSQSDSLLLVAYSNHEMVLWDIQDLAEVLGYTLVLSIVSKDWAHACVLLAVLC